MAARGLARALLVLVAPCGAAASLRSSQASARSQTIAVDVAMGDFADVGEACDSCYASYTRQGVAPGCVCMAYPDGARQKAFCATPVSATGWIKDQGGCMCNPHDMEAMGKTTCKPMED
mmetsp:Transcript_113865/g.328846  ORF Transcript_113865/g.328846 Transcript_113865/m.328846 type:complete len:119 (-) Transcript_113865:83-439(-)